jgi:hypothetical protein
MSKRLIMVLICHRHKLLDPIHKFLVPLIDTAAFLLGDASFKVFHALCPVFPVFLCLVIVLKYLNLILWMYFWSGEIVSMLKIYTEIQFCTFPN